MPFLAWPGWAHLRYAAWLSLANTLWFALVYGGCDALTAHRSLRLPVHVPAELRIPFVPAMTVFYMSLYGMFLLGPFVLRSRREFRAVVLTLALVTTFGGVGFLVYPAQLAFAPAREDQLGIWSGLYHFADALNLDYDLVPSLHVAFGVVCATVYARHASRAGKILLWLWATLIAASTTLIHQHHVVDVVAGWVVAVVGVKVVERRPRPNPHPPAPSPVPTLPPSPGEGEKGRDIKEEEKDVRIRTEIRGSWMNANREQARKLRRNSTPAEKALWDRLRGRRLHGLKFHRQYPIGPFIADFCCRERRIIVEVDGEVHEGEQSSARDEDRDRYLQGEGYLVLRISNQQVFEDLDSVLKQISNTTHTAPSSWVRSRIQGKK